MLRTNPLGNQEQCRRKLQATWLGLPAVVLKLTVPQRQTHTQLQGCIKSDKPPQGLWKFHMHCGGKSTSCFLVQAHALHLPSVGQDQSFLISQHCAISGPGPAVPDSRRSSDRYLTCPWLCCVSSNAGGAFRSMDLFHSLLKYFFFFSWGSHYSEDICVLHTVSEQNVTKPSCQYSAEMCLGEQSFHFLHAGPCHGDSNLDWAIERAKLSTNSLKKVPCGYDTCYDWEECPGMTSEWWDLSSPLDLKMERAESFTAP